MQTVSSIPGISDIVEALLSYSQRHFSRVDRLVRSSYLLDYTLASMDALVPSDDIANDQDGMLVCGDEMEDGGLSENNVGDDEETLPIMASSSVMHDNAVQSSANGQIADAGSSDDSSDDLDRQHDSADGQHQQHGSDVREADAHHEPEHKTRSVQGHAVHRQPHPDLQTNGMLATKRKKALKLKLGDMDQNIGDQKRLKKSAVKKQKPSKQ